MYHRVIAQQPAETLLVVCLCAAWCKTCTEFRETFDKLAQSDAGAQFVWLDVEDDSTLASLVRDDRDAVEVPEEIAGLPGVLGARF